MERGSDGRWMFERWPGTDTNPSERDHGQQSGHRRPWVVRVGELALQGGAVAFADNASPALWHWRYRPWT